MKSIKSAPLLKWIVFAPMLLLLGMIAGMIDGLYKVLKQMLLDILE